MPSPELFIGLMSGTSLDGVDGVLTDFSDGIRVLAHRATAFPPALRAELLALNERGGSDELHRAALAGNALSRVCAAVVADLRIAAADAPVAAIGLHGQTVRHRPGEFDGSGYTLQLGNPALLAELCGLRVVADFRSRDLAAGGQGAPLAPAFHRAMFGQPGAALTVLNLGGISNLSLLHTDASVQGFDCGPANGLLDHWCQRHTGQPYDRDGHWAASGQPQPALLARLLDEPYFALAPPKSTGRDLFNPAWLDARLAGVPALAPADVQATLAELTVRSVADGVERHARGSRDLIVCGGGALNRHLMQRLAAALPAMRVRSSAEHGMAPQQVEAAGFAWLARQTLLGLHGNLPKATGARGARVLGAVYPA